MTESTPGVNADAAPEDRGARDGMRINEDWAATTIGIVLVLLVLAGVIGKGIVP